MKTQIQIGLLALAAIATGACSTGYDTQEVEAVRDFVAANELEEVDKVRIYTQLHYRYLNEYFVTVETRRGDYLVEFRRRCRELWQREFTRDMIDERDSMNMIRPGFDTIRGCRIDKIYRITEVQAAELKDLGDAPGDEVFLPEPEDGDDVDNSDAADDTTG